MEGTLFSTAIAVVFVSQIVLNIFAKRAWMKWLPALLLGGLTGLCILFWGLGGWTNWGYIIILFGLCILLAADGVAVVFGSLIRRLVRKK